MSRRILAVVSDLFFATRIRDTAERLGLHTRVASPGEMPEVAASYAPDLVLIALEDAGDPIAALQRLKTDARTRSLPTLGYYSHVHDDVRTRALAAGCDQVLPKSAFTARLVRLLTEGIAR